MRYKRLQPPIVKGDAAALLDYLMRELEQIERTAESADTLTLKVLYAAPARPRNGMIAYADGTDWDPGSGQGVYYYDGSAWVFLG